MRGNNELVLNEASMIVAVQEYIDKRITVDTPKVVSVVVTDKMLTLFSVKLEAQ